jgi:GntR family transcriptional regulator
MQDAIDRDSPIPFYFQLSTLLEAEIVGGRWRSGTRLPGEEEIGRQFNLSRTTVRQALSRLEQEGLIRRDKGRGTFVAETRARSWLLQSAEGFFHDEVDRFGRTVTSHVVRAEVALLPRFASEALAAVEGSDGVVMERLRSVDGKIALFVTDYLPESLADAALSLGPEESLYERLRDRAGVVVAGGRRVVEAVKAGRRLASLLEVDATTPLVYIESVAWDRNLMPFHCYRTWLRTDRIRIEIQVSSSPPSRAAFDRTASAEPRQLPTF